MSRQQADSVRLTLSQVSLDRALDGMGTEAMMAATERLAARELRGQASVGQWTVHPNGAWTYVLETLP